MAKMLTRLRIDEVSSVDRGAGEGVKILLMKRNKDKTMANSKLASMFSKIFGHQGDNTETIDKALEGLAESVGTIVNEAADPTELSTSLAKTFEQFGDHLKSTLTAGPAVAKKEGPDMDLKSLAKALGLAETATEADVNKAFSDQQAATAAAVASVKKMEVENRVLKADFTPAELDHYEKAFPPGDDEDGDDKKKTKKAFRLASHSERGTIMKSAEPPVPAHIQKIMDDNEGLRKRLADLEAGGNLASFAKRAVELGLPEAKATMLQKAYAGDQASIDELETHMKSLIATARAGGVFKEFGSSGGSGIVDTAVEQLNGLAKALQKSDPKLSFPAAFAKVYEDPANVEIVKRERAENRPSAA